MANYQIDRINTREFSKRNNNGDYPTLETNIRIITTDGKGAFSNVKVEYEFMAEERNMLDAIQTKIQALAQIELGKFNS